MEAEMAVLRAAFLIQGLIVFQLDFFFTFSFADLRKVALQLMPAQAIND